MSTRGVNVARFVAGTPYWPVLSHPLLRRLLPGFVVSSLGDGMAVVAVSWLALELTPAPNRGLWVAGAVAAHTLPGAAGALLLGRFLRHRAPARLVGWDATLRAAALGAIPVASAVGELSIRLYIALLGISSVLHSWGQAGRYTLLARVLPERNHLAGPRSPLSAQPPPSSDRPWRECSSPGTEQSSSSPSTPSPSSSSPRRSTSSLALRRKHWTHTLNAPLRNPRPQARSRSSGLTPIPFS